MSHRVLLTDDAVHDLGDLDAYIATHDGPAAADHVLGRIEEELARLKEFLERGPHPPELVALGIREYREAFFKPYRIIYRVQKKSVYVYLIADGRRDMRRLLARRLLEG